MRPQPPVHPIGPVLLSLIAILIVGVVYGLFGIGKDALIFAVSLLIVLAMPVVVVFGITGRDRRSTSLTSARSMIRRRHISQLS